MKYVYFESVEASSDQWLSAGTPVFFVCCIQHHEVVHNSFCRDQFPNPEYRQRSEKHDQITFQSENTVPEWFHRIPHIIPAIESAAENKAAVLCSSI